MTFDLVVVTLDGTPGDPKRSRLIPVMLLESPVERLAKDDLRVPGKGPTNGSGEIMVAGVRHLLSCRCPCMHRTVAGT